MSNHQGLFVGTEHRADVKAIKKVVLEGLGIIFNIRGREARISVSGSSSKVEMKKKRKISWLWKEDAKFGFEMLDLKCVLDKQVDSSKQSCVWV